MVLVTSRAGIAEYRILNLVGKQPEIYTLPDAEGQYQNMVLYKKEAVAESPLLGKATVGQLLADKSTST